MGKLAFRQLFDFSESKCRFGSPTKYTQNHEAKGANQSGNVKSLSLPSKHQFKDRQKEEFHTIAFFFFGHPMSIPVVLLLIYHGGIIIHAFLLHCILDHIVDSMQL